MCSGPTRGVTLFTRLRRLLAAATVLSVFITLTAASPTIETPAQAQAAPPVRDTDAHAERLWQLQLQRAARNASHSGFGTVETRTVAADTPTRSQPRKDPKASGSASKKPATKPVKPATAKPSAKPAQPVKATGNMQAVVNYALAQVGDGYQWGATGPDRWDCSALTMKAFAQIGIKLPHQSGQQMRYGRAVSRSELRAGDLVFWNGHVALSLGGNAIVHAANPRTGVVRASIYGSPIGYRRLVG